VRRARARRRFRAGAAPPGQQTADEVKRRLDETRLRLKNEIPPLEEHD
jgi:hypothetical protein